MHGARTQKANYWVIEGVALYMESLRQKDGYFVLGGLDDLRVNAARSHLVQNDFYVPFAAVRRLRQGSAPAATRRS